MSESVQEEFRRIRENISKEIEVVSVNSKGELPPINGILTEFEPYISIDVLLSEIGKYTITCPFVGATGGINIIRDSNGQEIYRNDMLRFEKKLYNPFMNQEDNEYINGLKRAKFGNGHDIKMFDNE